MGANGAILRQNHTLLGCESLTGSVVQNRRRLRSCRTSQPATYILAIHSSPRCLPESMC